jgi:hypothetical protein
MLRSHFKIGLQARLGRSRRVLRFSVRGQEKTAVRNAREVNDRALVMRLQLGRVPQVVQWAMVVEAKRGAFPAV